MGKKFIHSAEAKRNDALKAGRRIMNADEAEKKIGKEHRIISMYIDNAKTYIQLSTGGLVLSVNFIEKFIIVKGERIHIDWLVITCWAFWLLTTLFGVLYQYAAIKHVEIIENDHDFLVYDRKWIKIVPDFMTDNPYIVYGTMMFCFYMGTIFFTVIAIIRLLSIGS